MKYARAHEIIGAIIAGIDPFTGQLLAPDSPLQHIDLVRALRVAAKLLAQEDTMTGAAVKAGNAHLPPKAGSAWSRAEEQELIIAFDAGSSEKELAEAHQRTKGSIHARLIRLGKLDPLTGQRRG